MSRLIKLFLPCLFFSCSGRQAIPKDIIPQEKMMAVMTDVLKADGLTEEINRRKMDTLVNQEIRAAKYYKQVFDIHKITKEDFFKSYNYYLQHPDFFKVILDSVYNRNERDKYKVYQKGIPVKPVRNEK
jgi:sulfite reductase alpha subunit-like flavoprotein